MFKTRKRLLIWITYRGAVRLGLLAGMLTVVAILLSYDMFTIRVWSNFTLPLSGQVIAIDPGHGGVDGGAESEDGLQEKEINLAIALFLRDYLQQAGAWVVMTRETDMDLADPATTGLSRRKTEDLHRRMQLVTDHQADLFISIHVNSIRSSRWRGAQSFFHPGREEGKQLAANIQQSIKTGLNNTDRDVNAIQNMYLLKSLAIPGALVEVGFISNPAEAALLRDPKYQQQMASAIYNGILRYYAGERVETPW